MLTINKQNILKFLQKNRIWFFPGAFLLILMGLTLIWLGMTQTITILVDGESCQVRTPALRVSSALRAAGFDLQETDRSFPSGDTWFWNRSTIRFEPAHSILVKTPEEERWLLSAETIPANLLKEAGIPIFPSDSILVNGSPIDPQQPSDVQGPLMIQFHPASQIILELDGNEFLIYSNQPTLGAALEEADIFLEEADWLSVDLHSPLEPSMEVQVRRARPIKVRTSDGVYVGQTAARSVGEALLEIGIPLQNLDYSIPAEDAPVPEDAEIKVIRVVEEVSLVTEEVPYETKYQEDPEAPLDQTSVIQPGQVGIYASRERVRYADGEEVWRDLDETWQASESRPAILGYGSKIVVQTDVVNGETIEYYRKLTVYATSYKPCIPNTDICYYGTASGLPVEKGVIAVTRAWFNLMQGQRVYVPGYGYGVIADIGGGYEGRPWIDLGYSEDAYDPVPNGWYTMYLLTPVPSYVPTILP